MIGNSDETLVAPVSPQPEDATVISKGLMNPYVGPRAFEANQRQFFFGRDEETAILEGLVMSSRASLLFAQSGAGKSSLLRAGLFPSLTRQMKIGRGPRAHLYQKMQVFPITNVSGGNPPGMTRKIKNIYMFNALVSLYPADEECDNIAELTLTDAMACLIGPPRSALVAVGDESATLVQPAEPGTNGDSAPAALRGDTVRRLLIFDQFEEIFTHYPERYREREDFFRQVSQALDEFPNLHVLFSMREDFIAELTPFRNLLPQGLRARFRLELLKPAAALHAITEPAEKAGRIFAPGVAEGLVKNLCGAKSGQKAIDLEDEDDRGEYVEPVHLQIVCRQLWEKLPSKQVVIQAKDVEAFADVDNALTGFYEGALKSVLSNETLKKTLSERKLRAWFSGKLITPAHTRGLVYRDKTLTEGLPNEAIDILNEAYIIRARVHGSDTWYELAHDRLVGPVLQSNQDWHEHRYNNPLERAARGWTESQRSPEKLLDGVLLKEAQQYAVDNPADVLQEERELLDESQRLQEQRERERQEARKRRRRTFIAGGVVIALLAILTLVGFSLMAYALSQEDLAIASAKEAEAARLAAVDSAENARESEQNAIKSEANAKASQLEAEESARVAQEKEQQARQAARLALSRQLAGQSLANLDNQYDLALLLALEARNFADTQQAQDALFAATYHKPYLTTFLHGHVDGITQVKYSQDGTLLASAGNDQTVRIWDVESRQQVGEPLAGHTARVTGIDWSSDGRFLVSASEDWSFILWDVEAMEMVYQAPEDFFYGVLTAVAFSPEGDKIALNSEFGDILIWDVDQQEIVADLNLPDYEYVYASPILVFSPDGGLLASDGGNGDILLWDMEALDLGYTLPGYPDDGSAYDVNTGYLRGHTEDVLTLDFSPDGTRLASGGYDTTIIIHDLMDSRNTRSIEPGASWIWSLAFSANGETLAAGYDNHGLELWDVTGLWSWDGKLSGHAAVATSVDFAPDEDSLRLASASWDSTIILWDMSIDYPLLQWHYDELHEVTSQVFLPDNNLLVVGDVSGSVKLWDLGEDIVVNTVENPTSTCWDDPEWNEEGECPYSITSLAASPDESLLAIGDASGGVYLWDIAKEEWAGDPIEAHDYGVTAMVFTADGSKLITGGDDWIVQVWDVETQTVVGEMLEHTEGITDLVLRPDHNQVISSSWDKTIMIWDLDTYELVGKPMRGHGEGVLALALSPDENILASAGNDQIVRLWDLGQPGKSLGSLFGHLAGVRDLAYSADGKTIASAGSEGTVILWDVENRQARGLPMYSFWDSQNVVQFNPLDGSVISADATGFIYVWNMNYGDWVQQACQVANRNLTQAEWNQFIGEDVPYEETCP